MRAKLRVTSTLWPPAIDLPSPGWTLMGHAITASRRSLFAPTDIASLAVFRVAFGAILFWEVCRYFAHGWIHDLWIEPAFHFAYPGFGWVHPWPGHGMYLHMAALGVLAIFIALGFLYRVSAALFFLGFTYCFLLERALYLNHLYFVSLVSFLMMFAPAHRALSLDARLRPALRTEVIPFWPLFLLRTQLAVVYLYAGIAKLNPDWFRGEPLRSWLRDKSQTPVVGWIFERPETFHFLAWGGLAFDLFIVPLLLWKRTRAFAFIAAVLFHVLNAWFFRIGIFPWFSIAMTTLFFDPSWPRRFMRGRRPHEIASSAGHADPAPARASSVFARRAIVLFAGVYVAVQLLVPLRHWLYPGDVTWTEEGHEFSWRMKLRSKKGEAEFVLTNTATGERWTELPEMHLAPWQARAMVKRPELLRQFAHYLAAIHERDLGTPVEVRVRSTVRLNDHPPAPLVDPSIDLAREPYRLGPASWITRGPDRGFDQ